MSVAERPDFRIFSLLEKSRKDNSEVLVWGLLNCLFWIFSPLSYDVSQPLS